MSNEKVIPRDIWKKFQEYWDSTEYENLDAGKIKDLFGKYLFVSLPKNVKYKNDIDIWYDKMKELREKGKAFGGYTIDLSKDTTPLNKLFPKPMNPAEMNKILWDYIKTKK